MASARNEVPKAARGGCGERVPPPHRQRGLGGGYAPPQIMFPILSSKWQVLVHFES